MVVIKRAEKGSWEEGTAVICLNKPEAKKIKCSICGELFREGQLVFSCEFCKKIIHELCAGSKRRGLNCTHSDESCFYKGHVLVEGEE